MLIQVKELIKQLKGLPQTTQIGAYDIRCVDKTGGNAIHLFNLDIAEEEKIEEPRKIGF